MQGHQVKLELPDSPLAAKLLVVALRTFLPQEEELFFVETATYETHAAFIRGKVVWFTVSHHHARQEQKESLLFSPQLA